MGAARVVTATSGATNIALAKSFGADLVIDYKVEDIFSALPDDSVDLVYDSTQMTCAAPPSRPTSTNLELSAPDMLECMSRDDQITVEKARQTELCPR